MTKWPENSKTYWYCVKWREKDHPGVRRRCYESLKAARKLRKKVRNKVKPKLYRRKK